MQFLFQQPAGACFQVVVLAGAGRLPSSGSAPLSATALEHRVRHPASLWGSARRASGAQTRTRASNCASNRQRAGTMSAASSSPSPGPRCVCRLSHHCRWSRAMRPSPLLGWKHLAAARRCRTDSRFRCLSQEFIACLASSLALGPVPETFETLQLPRESGQLSIQGGTRKLAGWQLPHPHAQACCHRFRRSR